MFIRTGDVTDANSPSQDRCATQIIYAKRLSNGRGPGQLADSMGKLWTNLPYLVEDMIEAWDTQSMKLNTTYRRNFAASTARLLGLVVCDSRISVCALWLLRGALETSRLLFIATAEVGNGEGRKKPCVEELLPAAVVRSRVG